MQSLNTVLRLGRRSCALLASVARSRPLAVSLLAAGTAQLVLTAAGLPGWTCPCLTAFGIPCPGCGVTRAVLALLAGDLRGALRIHAFAPVFAGVLALLTAAVVLGPAARARLAAALQFLEERTAIGPLLLGALLVYWATRLTLDGAAFMALVR